MPAVADATRMKAANGRIESARSLGSRSARCSAARWRRAAGRSSRSLIDAASFVVVAVVALVLRPRRAPARDRAGLGRARDGIVFLLRDRVLALVISVAFVSLLSLDGVGDRRGLLRDRRPRRRRPRLRRPHDGVDGGHGARRDRAAAPRAGRRARRPSRSSPSPSRASGSRSRRSGSRSASPSSPTSSAARAGPEERPHPHAHPRARPRAAPRPRVRGLQRRCATGPSSWRWRAAACW